MNRNKVKSKERKAKALARKKAKREANVDLTKRAINAERALIKREHKLAIAELKKAWELKPAVKLKRGRAPLIVTSPKPAGRNLKITPVVDLKREARIKEWDLRRKKIKAYNEKKSETLAKAVA